MKSRIMCAFCTFTVLSALTFGTNGLVSHNQGAVSLDGMNNYDWWYGCSPTSAGMVMGYYDRLGYGNLVPAVQTERLPSDSAGNPIHDIIASAGHINDFYSRGYLGENDDLPGPPLRSFDSLADFMGTSQDAYGNVNGSTTFWNFIDGSRMYDSDILALGDFYSNSSGMYGIREFVEYSGYRVASLFNQYVYGYHGNTRGFTFDDYIAEIDAGRPVIIHVEGHSMYGYGYDPAASEVLLYDTWNPGEKRMAWGGAYQGLDHYGVTALALAIPEPATLSLLMLGGLTLFVKRIR